MANQRKSEARQKKISQYETCRRMAKTWGAWWVSMNTPWGEKECDLTPVQLQGKKVSVAKKSKKADPVV